MAKLYQQIKQQIIRSLEDDAKRVIQECVNERTYTHRSKNLYDSYGYAIYDNRKLIRSGFLSTAPQAKKPRKWYGKNMYGREEIKNFFENEYTPKDGITLAIAAAMPYAKILEDGSGQLHHSYKVISMSYEKLKAIASNYKATVSIIK